MIPGSDLRLRATRGVPLAALLALAASASGARAQGAPALPSAEPAMSAGRTFGQRDGAALYAQVCAACHQADGAGAVGAGAYPALARDERLAAAGYPVALVLHGRGGMPAVGRMMSDAQVAEVVNYVRTHFGNRYEDGVTADDVKAARP